MAKPKIITVSVDLLRPAPWNYKKPGTDRQIKKLVASINKDRSLGVLAVREIDGDLYEVIDGNHRLEAIQSLEWETVEVESFGKLAQADAIILSRRRNLLWFDDDETAFAELIRDEVLPRYSLTALSEFMPEDLGDISEIGEYDLSTIVPNSPEDDKIKIDITTSEEDLKRWNTALSRRRKDPAYLFKEMLNHARAK